MTSYRDCLRQITDSFESAGFLNSRREAENLLCDALDCDWQYFDSHLESLVNNDKLDLICSWVDRRLSGEPLAYIHGQVEFYGCLFRINRHVLIPRQETEILVDQIVSFLKHKKCEGKILWDVCCGSGCIGIAIKKALPDLTVFLSDISKEALLLASENARFNNVEVTCLLGDLLEPFGASKADYVVCNPPYLSDEEYISLDYEVKNFEPKEALTAGITGLEIYQRLAKDLPCHMNKSGFVWMEIGYNQGKLVENCFDDCFWLNKYFKNDWAGHNRFFFLENE